MSDTTIDDVFKNLVAVYDEAGELGEIPSKVGFRITGIPEAKSALYDLILKEVVGEDEKVYGNIDGVTIANATALYDNQLRATQRNKLKELFDV